MASPQAWVEFYVRGPSHGNLPFVSIIFVTHKLADDTVATIASLDLR